LKERDGEVKWSGSVSTEAIMLSEKGCVQLGIGSRTDIGRVRSNNEDSCFVSPRLNLFVVSDGMGGEAHGELASSIAIDTIERYCSGEIAEDLIYYGEARRPDFSEKTHRLAHAVRLANDKIHETAQTDPLLYGMGATVV